MAEKPATSKKTKRQPKNAAKSTKAETSATNRELQVANTKELSGSDDPNFVNVLVNQVASSLWAPSQKSDADKMNAVKAAVAAMAGIAPRDELEGMVAAQMVATHNGAMECLRRAMIPDQSFEGRDVNIKHAAKLMSLYTQQMAALDKHRGGGRQKITVEHVTVEAGGQAIVGHVNHGGAPRSSVAPAPEAVAAPTDGALKPLSEDITPEPEKVPSSSRSKKRRR